MIYSPNNDVPLATIKESPVLQREGVTQNNFEKSGNTVPTMEGKSFYHIMVYGILSTRSEFCNEQ